MQPGSLSELLLSESRAVPQNLDVERKALQKRVPHARLLQKNVYVNL